MPHAPAHALGGRQPSAGTSGHLPPTMFVDRSDRACQARSNSRPRNSVHEEILVWFKGLVAVTIPLAAFATGLRTSGTLQAAWLWRHPALLDRSLLCLLLIVPLWAVLAMQVLQVSPLVKTGILASVLAIGIGPPAALERTQKTETPIEYEIGLDVSLMLLSVVFLPAAVALHGAIFHHDVRL